MLAFHIPASLRQRRNRHAADSQIADAHGCADNVHDGIHRSYFMEMHLFHRKPVGSGLCLRHQAEHLLRQTARLFILQTVNDLVNIMDISMHMRVVVIVSVAMIMGMAVIFVMVVAVISMMVVIVIMVLVMVMSMAVSVIMFFVIVMMIMIMIVAMIMLLLFQMHIEIIGVNAAFLRPAKVQVISADSQLLKLLHKTLPAGAQV